MNQEKLDKRLFTDEEDQKVTFSKQTIMENMIEGIFNNKNQQVDNEELLINQYIQSTLKLQDLKIQRADLERRVNYLQHQLEQSRDHLYGEDSLSGG